MSKAKPVGKIISPEIFYEDIVKIDPSLPREIKKFTKRLEQELSIRVGFRGAMNFWWTPLEGPELNLGYIKRKGSVWIDSHSKSDRAAKYLKTYLQELADNIPDGDASKTNGNVFYLLRVEGKLPQIKGLLPHFSTWFKAIKRLQARF